MTPKRRFHIQLPRPEERSPLDYGLFVEALFHALQIKAQVESEPLPDQLDMVDLFWLKQGVRPTPANRSGLVALDVLNDAYAHHPQRDALLNRCSALFDLFPLLPQDLMLRSASGLCAWNLAVYETAATSHLHCGLGFAPAYFIAEARRLLPKYPHCDELTRGRLLRPLRKRFGNALRSDLGNVTLRLGRPWLWLVVEYRGFGRLPAVFEMCWMPEVAKVENDFPQTMSQLCQALKWLMETSPAGLAEYGIGQALLKNKALEQLLAAGGEAA